MRSARAESDDHVEIRRDLTLLRPIHRRPLPCTGLIRLRRRALRGDWYSYEEVLLPCPKAEAAASISAGPFLLISHQAFDCRQPQHTAHRLRRDGQQGAQSPVRLPACPTRASEESSYRSREGSTVRLLLGSSPRRTDTSARAHSKDKAQVTQTSRLNERRAAREVEEMEIEIKNLKEQLANQNVSRPFDDPDRFPVRTLFLNACVRRVPLSPTQHERPGVLRTSPRCLT